MPMSENFWHNLPKPFFALAPMADVTDAAFRELIAKYGKPDVMYTEFVSADGLCSVGREKLLIDFKYSNAEHPIVAQIFSGKLDNIYQAAERSPSLKSAVLKMRIESLHCVASLATTLRISTSNSHWERF